MAEEFDEEMQAFEDRYGKRNSDNGGSGNSMKIIVAVLSVIAVGLVGVLAYVWISNNRLVGELNCEKDDLTLQLDSLRSDYAALSTDNAALNDSLDVEKMKVESLIEELRNTQATDRAKIRQYQKEIGTLRAIMKSYIKQIDSLNTLNIELREEAREAHREAEQHKQKYADLKKISDKNAERASAGAVLKARGISLTAINKSNKSTDRSSRANKLKACLSLIENQIAEKGDRTVYIKVFAPDGTQLGGSQQTPFTCKGEDMIASASRVVDYQGEEIEVCVYFTRSQDAKFSKGVYRVEVYTSESALGSAELVLR